MNAKLNNLRPQKRRRLIDLVKEAGLDVSDWGDFAGGDSKAGSNPKYCYEWSFIQNRLIILNLWYSNCRLQNGKIVQRLTPTQRARREQKHVWKSRAAKFEHAIRTAYLLRLPLTIVLVDGNQRTKFTAKAKASSVKKRELDSVCWAVSSFDPKTGNCVLERGLRPVVPKNHIVLGDVNEEWFEGELRKRYQFYRKRERRLRNLKIEDALFKNKGVLICEVPNCGFDFTKVYGSLGENFAEVHHKFPLSRMRQKVRNTTLNDLVIVCSNCHAMIHRFGACRPIKSLITLKTPSTLPTK